MKTLATVMYSSPSNIALVKYWGKHGDQLPQNASISFTLKNAVTKMKLEVFEKNETDSNEISLEFFFENKINPKFQEKIAKFLLKEKHRFNWLAKTHLKISSTNTFPHSSGIASSASSMSALCLCLLTADEEITGIKRSEAEFKKSASELSRLASGSAGRSIFPVMASWGKTDSVPESSDQYATPFLDLHENFKGYCDSILIVSAEEKSVSSRAGHSLMENHPYRENRFAQARSNMNELVSVLRTGDMDRFISLVEEEALSLHALMMTSRPSFILLRPESLKLIDMIREFRHESQIPACFTIDAGPNIHLLYPAKFNAQVKAWIEKDLLSVVPGLKWIHDEAGMGPVKIND
jgi:diphosphomevalonate decarboxylase